LDGNDEVGSFAVVISNVSFWCLLVKLVGQILLCLSFQVLDLLSVLGEFSLVIPFSPLYGFDKPLGDLHDGFWVVNVKL
jgi:hypothetical protein